MITTLMPLGNNEGIDQLSHLQSNLLMEAFIVLLRNQLSQVTAFPTRLHVHQTKTHCTLWVAKYQQYLQVDSEHFDQNKWKRMLI